MVQFGLSKYIPLDLSTNSEFPTKILVFGILLSTLVFELFSLRSAFSLSATNVKSNFCNSFVSFLSPLINTSTSSASRKWFGHFPSILIPPHPRSNFLNSCSSAASNKSGDWESPCLTPLSSLKSGPFRPFLCTLVYSWYKLSSVCLFNFGVDPPHFRRLS